MLRRVKKEVENEMPPKTEIDIKCDMTPRQERLYKMVKNKVSLTDILNSRTEKNVNALMNIIMHLRKVCALSNKRSLAPSWLEICHEDM